MSSASQTLLSAVVAVGAGTAFDLSVLPRYQGGAHSFVVSGTFVGSVDIEASIDGGVTFFALKTFTDAGGHFPVGGVYTHIQGNVTAYTSGDITLDVRYGLLQDLKTTIDTVSTNINTLLSRLSAARAGFLDELSSINLPADVTTLISRLTSARAGLLDNLTRLDATISGISVTAQIQSLVKQLRKEGRNV